MAKQGQDNPNLKDRKRRRKWPWVLAAVLVVIILILILVPVVLSSRGFTQWVQAKIDRSTGGQANIGDLSVGWFSGVQVADFSFRGPNGWAEVDIDRITTQPSYSSLLSGTLALDRTVINQPRVALDLRERPPSTAKQPSISMNQLERLHDVVVHDGTVQLTDTTGKTAQIANLNSELNIRPPGHTSSFSAEMVVAAAQGPGRIETVGKATPSKKTGWSLKGTTGDVTVEVNDLSLESVAPFLELAGLQVQARGQVSGNVIAAVQDGQLENVNASIIGRDIDIAGPALQGDRLQTAQLDVRANLTQAAGAVDVDQLNVRTDWASLSATGTIPKTPASLTQLLERGEAYNVRGNFDINLAALLSQLPNTLGVPPGTQITGGRATGNIDTTTEGGRATIVAKVEVLGLAGVANNQKVSLSGPVSTTLRLSTDKQGPQLENLSVSAPFAKLDASGSFKQIKYQGQTDLAALQSQLGPFINLGSYRVAGQLASQGQISLGEKVTGIAGTLSARQLALAAPDGNSVAEPQANVEFTLGLSTQDRVLAISTLTANASFGTISIKDATVPYGQGSQAPLNLVASASNVNLSRLEPYAVLFASFPKQLQLGGIAQSQVTVTRKENVYRFYLDATRIQNFQLVSQGKPPFQQAEVTAFFDVYVNPNQKTINRANWQVKSPQITIKGQLTQTSQASTIKAQGALDAQLDWAAVAPLVSAFVPGQLTVAGQRQVALSFASTYPVGQPRGLLAHLNTQTAVGFDRAQYMGFDVGPTEVDIRVENGLMRIAPLSTTVNNGKVNFAGEANLGQTPVVLRTSTPLHLAQGIQINQETTERLLKYVNPIFANVVGATGIANFDLQRSIIPLAAGAKNQAELNGTLWIDQLQLGASGILNQILSVSGQSVRGQRLTIRPTNLVLQNGVVRYDDMEIDVGDNPINFRGSVGLNGALNMTVVLPYTIEGRTVRVGQPEAGQRIVLPLTGTINQPQLNLQDLLKYQIQGQLQEQIQKGLEELFKKKR